MKAVSPLLLRMCSVKPISHLACDVSTEPVNCPYPPFPQVSAKPPCIVGCAIFVWIHELHSLYNLVSRGVCQVFRLLLAACAVPVNSQGYCTVILKQLHHGRAVALRLTPFSNRYITLAILAVLHDHFVSVLQRN